MPITFYKAILGSTKKTATLKQFRTNKISKIKPFSYSRQIWLMKTNENAKENKIKQQNCRNLLLEHQLKKYIQTALYQCARADDEILQSFNKYKKSRKVITASNVKNRSDQDKYDLRTKK